MPENKILNVEGLSNFYEARRFGLRKRKVKVLKNVNFHINKQEFFGLVGESGCGKSTLCKAVLGLIDYEGTISICNMDCKRDKKKDMAKKVQAVFQDPMSALNPKKTIGFLLEEPLKIHKIGTKEERRRRVDEILNLVGLDSSYKNRYPHELSGGQRQRVCIGCAIILNPQLIIADEAISSLDVSVGAQILNFFQELHDSLDLSLLFISHNLELVYYLCDRIAVMYKGKIIEMGEAKEVYYHPLHPYTQMLLSAIPSLNNEVKAESGLKDKNFIKDTLNEGCNYYAFCNKAKEDCKVMENYLINMSEKSETSHYVSCPYCLEYI